MGSSTGMGRSKWKSKLQTDKISLEMALKTPLWKMIWIGEPEREIEVKMTYNDLKFICNLIEEYMQSDNKGNKAND